jgi:hypothetical protein
MIQRSIITDLLILLLAVLLFYHSFLSADSITPGSDMVNLFYPLKVFATRTLAEGFIPLWNPYNFCGTPFFASLQPAVFYPADLLLFKDENHVLALNMYKLLHLWLMANFMYLLLHVELKRTRLAAICGAMILPFGAFVVGHLEHVNQLAALTWLPLLFILLRRILQPKKLILVPLFSLALACQIFAGHPQYVFYTLLLIVFYLIFWLPFGRRYTLNQRFAGVPKTALAIGLGLLAVAVQILPAQELASHSYRIFNDYSYATEFSMAPKFLLTYLYPSAFGTYAKPLPGGDNLSEYGCYIGILPLLLAFVGLGYAWQRRSREHLFFAILAIFALYMAMGYYTAVYRIAFSLFPVLKDFRVPARFLCLTTFAFSILAAYGLDCLFEHPVVASGLLKRWKILFVLAIPVIIFGDLFLASTNERFNAPMRASLIEHARNPWDVLQTDSSLCRTFRLMIHDADFYANDRPQAVVARYQRLQPNTNMVEKIELLDGYEEGLLPLVRYKDFLLTFNRNIRSAEPDTVLLGLMNAKYIYTDYMMWGDTYSALPVQSERLERVPLPEPWNINLPYRMYRSRDWRPRAFWEDELEGHIDLRALEGTYLTTGTLAAGYSQERRDYTLPNQPTRPRTKRESLSLYAVGPGRIEIVKDPLDEGDVLVSQASYPGWTVRMGGDCYPLLPVDAILSRFYAPKNITSITVSYEPFSFRLGLYVSLLTLAVVVLIYTLWVVQHFSSATGRRTP